MNTTLISTTRGISFDPQAAKRARLEKQREMNRMAVEVEKAYRQHKTPQQRAAEREGRRGGHAVCERRGICTCTVGGLS